jgi:hypothetical protein
MTRYTPPPRALRKAKLDNLALLPASLLPFKAEFQAIANQQPPGTTLVVMPKAAGKPSQTLGTVASQLQAKGHLVKVVPATQIVFTPCRASLPLCKGG